jgi:pimeloyl-ACP methyl ester carboxylesterase
MKKIVAFILVLAAPVLHAAAPSSITLQHQCFAEPVFAGTACLYHTPIDATRKTLLFVHGIGGNGADDWKWQIAPLADQYNLLLPDLPGFGQSSKQFADYSPENYARFLRFITRRYTDQPIHIMGHSLGGAVALLYAAYYPQDVERIVVTDVAGVLHKIAYSKSFVGNWTGYFLGDSVGRFFRGITGEWLSRVDEISTPDTLQSGKEYSSKTIASFALINSNFAPYLELITAPVLIIWEEGDRITPLRTGQALAARLRYSRLETIPGRGHMPMQESAEIFNQKISAFFATAKDRLLAELQQSKAAPAQQLTPLSLTCEDKNNMVFEGNFEKLELRNCTNIRIINSTLQQLVTRESRFEIINSRIESDAIALEMDGSEAIITASQIIGEIAIAASGSRIDIAGVELAGRRSSLYNRRGSEFLFSICTLNSPIFSGPIHGLEVLEHGGEL